MGRLVLLGAENLATCRILRPVLRELHDEIDYLIMVPNLPASSSRDRDRFRRLVSRASPGFVAFKLAEIHLHHALALPLGRTLHQEAKRYGVEVRDYPSIKDPQLLADLRAAAPEYLLNGGPALVGADILEVPQTTFNCHGARLPEYRGAANYVWVLNEGETHAYASVQEMYLALDEGPLFAERALRIGPHWSAYRLNYEVAGMAGELYAEVARTILDSGLPEPIDRSGAPVGNRGFPQRPDLAKLRRSGRRLLRPSDVLSCM